MRCCMAQFVDFDYRAWIFLGKLLRIYNLVPFVYSNPDTQEIDQYDSLTVKWRYICSLSMMVFILPFVYQRNLANLRYVSLLIVASVFYTIFLAIFEFYSYYQTFHDSPDYVVYWISKPPTISWIRNLSPFMLAYYSHALFFYVRGEMMNKTSRRVRKLINIIAMVLLSFFALFSGLAYLSLGEKLIPTMFTLRRPISRLIS